MLIQPYDLSSLHFAFSYKVYLRWHTRRRRPLPALANLTQAQAASLVAPYRLQLLEFESDEVSALAVLSLRPEETVSACASKLKGRISKHLSEVSAGGSPARLLCTGYFACTAGQSTADMVKGYLDKQSAHHGYSQRVLPPVYARTFAPTPEIESALSPKHACAVLQLHVVLATEHRKGVFGAASGKAVTARWQGLHDARRFFITKVSFLPDHVHVALRLHPAAAPADVVLGLMNAAQELVFRDYAEHVIQAGVQRLWQPSAYVGSYGDITSGKMRGYIRKWAAQDE